MTGNIVMGNNAVTSSSNPTDDTHLARKGYVDSILGSATSSALVCYSDYKSLRGGNISFKCGN